MTAVIGSLPAAFLKREELIAGIVIIATRRSKALTIWSPISATAKGYLVVTGKARRPAKTSFLHLSLTNGDD